MRILVPLVLAALVVASASAAGSPDFALRRVAQTRTTVTFEWNRQPGAAGFRFVRNGTVVASTHDPSTTSVTFWRGARYAVEVLRRSAQGRLTPAKRATIAVARGSKPRDGMRLVFRRAPSVPFALRLVAQTPRKVTFAWKRQPEAEGYRFVRNGVVVAKTLDPSTTSATFWKGRRYAVELLRATPSKRVVPVRRASAFVTGTTKRGSRAGRLVFVPAPRVSFSLRLADRNGKKLTFAWKRPHGADGYRFMRNGVVVSSTFDPSTTSVTFWKGFRYAVEVLRKVSKGEAVPVTWALASTRRASLGRITTPKPRPRNTPPPSRPGSSQAPSQPSESTPPRKSSPPEPSKPAPAPQKPPAPPAPSPPPTPAPTPAPPAVGPGGVVTLAGTYSPDELFAAVALAPPGPVTVRGGFTVTGGFDVPRSDLAIEDATINGAVEFGPGTSGSSLRSSSASGFYIYGADNITIEGNTFDGHGQSSGIKMWDKPAGNTPDAWVIRNNTFKNFYMSDDSHTQALYVGYATDGLIEGNTFTNNGNTAHIFFTWFGNQADSGSSYPRNICVRGNSFGPTHTAYVDVNLRDEIPLSANIRIQSDANVDREEFKRSC